MFIEVTENINGSLSKKMINTDCIKILECAGKGKAAVKFKDNSNTMFIEETYVDIVALLEKSNKTN